jgi:hypothetical protein
VTADGPGSKGEIGRYRVACGFRRGRAMKKAFLPPTDWRYAHQW